MSQGKREDRGFLDEDPSDQLSNANLDMYALANSAENIEDSLYHWLSVFVTPNTTHGKWSGKNPVANLVRKIMKTEYYGEFRIMENDVLDDVLCSPDLDQVREVIRAEKKKGDEARSFVALHNTEPKLHEHDPQTIQFMILVIPEILEACSYPEKRLFAYILVDSELDVFLDYISKDTESIKKFKEILAELYEKMSQTESLPKKNGQDVRAIRRVSKRDFVTQGKEHRIGSSKIYRGIVKSFESKMRPLFGRPLK